MSIILIFVSILLFNLFYARIISKKQIIFYKYFIYFIYFTILLFFLDQKYKLNIFSLENITIYFLTFLSSFLTIGLRYFESPTDLINYELKKSENFISVETLITNIQKKNIISERIKDLTKQKLISNNNETIELTKSGKKFSKLFWKIKTLFNLKVEG